MNQITKDIKNIILDYYYQLIFNDVLTQLKRGFPGNIDIFRFQVYELSFVDALLEIEESIIGFLICNTCGNYLDEELYLETDNFKGNVRPKCGMRCRCFQDMDIY
jgi:hypothetical protein